MLIKSYNERINEKERDYILSQNSAVKRSAFVLTFGCQQNEADSERIRGIVAELGFSQAGSTEEADLIILNTCAIRAHAEDKVFSLLGNLKAQKQEKPDTILAVCGCMAAEAEVVKRINKRFGFVDFTLEPNALELLPHLIYEAMRNGERSFAIGVDDGGITEDIPVVRSSGIRAWVSIMYGCNNFCSYCIVPYVRGRERSRKSADVIRECRELISSGIKEITLLGQNVNSYNSDLSFAQLLGEIAKNEGDFTLRFMTSHPKDVSDELISVMAENSDKIAPYFHLPLQSGSDKILKAMRRTYNREKFLDTVSRLRSAIPNIVITTDIIVGFPGESDEDFEDTLDMLSRVEFDAVYGFLYSEREGTSAVKLEGKVAKDVKSERLSKVFELQDVISQKKNDAYVGNIERVLVNFVNDEKIANATTFSGKFVRFPAESCSVGDVVSVLIKKAAPHALNAEIITTKK